MIESHAIIGTLTLAFVGLAGVLLLVRWWAPQFKQRMQFAGRLQREGLLALTPQCSVALVRIGQETLVLGVTPHTVTLLTKTQGQDVREGTPQQDEGALTEPRRGVEAGT